MNALYFFNKTFYPFDLVNQLTISKTSLLVCLTDSS